jgi:hypothetical protein
MRETKIVASFRITESTYGDKTFYAVGLTGAVLYQSSQYNDCYIWLNDYVYALLQKNPE